MFKIYSPNKAVDFYRAHGLRPPADLPDLDGLSVDLSTPLTSKPRPVFERFLSRGDIAMIYGPPNIGKSPFADSIMYALARGCDLNPLHTTSTAMSVLMVCGEMRDDQLKKDKRGMKRCSPLQERTPFLKCHAYPKTWPHLKDNSFWKTR